VRYASLFSGVGGFESGLNKLGFICVFASEIDKFASKAYETLYGCKPSGDITKIDADLIPDHDLLTAGFPCQAFSYAGKRRGFEDTRGTLFFEIARIAKVKKPKYLLLENVKGLLSHDKGKTFEIMIKVLSSLGYTVDYTILNSKYFGVPQNRERLFIVGILNEKVEPYKVEGNDVLSKSKRKMNELGINTFNFPFPNNQEVTSRLRDVLEEDVDVKYYLSEEKTKRFIREFDSTHRRTHAIEVRSVAAPDRLKKRHNGRRIKEDDEPSFTLTVTDRHGVVIGQYPNFRIRRLTPLECFRLQGFPDEYFRKLKDAGISDTQLYKLAGNAVTVPVIEEIGRSILNFEKGDDSNQPEHESEPEEQLNLF